MSASVSQTETDAIVLGVFSIKFITIYILFMHSLTSAKYSYKINAKNVFLHLLLGLWMGTTKFFSS